jgi:isocitrate/isopropylmalate dehydrogenase
MKSAAETIRGAVDTVLASGAGTPDLGGNLSTRQMADRIIENIR